MDDAAKAQSLRRLTWLAAGALGWAALILSKLLWLQVLHHQEYAGWARQQQERLVEIPAPRGAIFDRQGRPLAISVPLESVFVNPLRVPDLQVAAELLARILDLDRSELYGRLERALAKHRGFLWVKRKITRTEAERLRSLRLEWIEFQTESQRYYPKDTLAAHVLGSVDHEERGNAGVELSLEAELRGQAGAERVLTDVKRRGIDSRPSAEARAGTPITLTIDERIQFAAERELRKAAEAHQARTGSVVVMNPYTGEILALANYPTFDPNIPPKPGEDPVKRFDQAVSVPFEPGSVFKVITLSAALETTNLRPDSPIHCGNGILRLPGRVIHEAKHGYGVLPMELVLAKSSNIGAIQIGFKVGERNMYEYVRRFGFGSASGVPLPAESAGMFRKLDRWGTTSLASIAMGHEITTTTVQLARACSVIANGGLLVRPKVVLKRGAEGAGAASEPPPRVLRPETVITMRQMMEGVVLHGTGKGARLEGYTSGGKTGTAQIFDLKTHRYTHFYNASFMGFAPVTNPALVIAVTLNGTSGGSAAYGGAVSAPVFKAVATEALRILDVPRDLPDAPAAGGNEAPVDMDDLAIADLGGGGPHVVEEEAGMGEPVLAMEDQPAAQSGPKVPNFRGKTMRAVLAQASSLGLPVLLAGSGVAREQAPRAGSILRQGERIRVQFAR